MRSATECAERVLAAKGTGDYPTPTVARRAAAPRFAGVEAARGFLVPTRANGTGRRRMEVYRPQADDSAPIAHLWPNARPPPERHAGRIGSGHPLIPTRHRFVIARRMTRQNENGRECANTHGRSGFPVRPPLANPAKGFQTMSDRHPTQSARAVNTDVSSPNSDLERGVLRADEFYTYEALMRRLPENTAEDAIRRLVNNRSLPVHRIGKFSWFFGAEIIAASRDAPDEG